jgi:hypothetical protein
VIGIDRFAPPQQVTGQEPACWGVDPEVFFGPADSPAGRPLHLWERRALAVCAGCPVVMACLAETLKFPAAEQYGVVGGMTAGQRRTALRASRRGRGRAQGPRRGGKDDLRPLRREGRPIRGSGPAATRRRRLGDGVDDSAVAARAGRSPKTSSPQGEPGFTASEMG